MALPASPLLKMKRVTGVRKSSVQSVSIKFTEIQKATITDRMTATLPIISIPQKSIRLMLALSEPYCIIYHPKVPIIATVNAIENYRIENNRVQLELECSNVLRPKKK